MTLAGLHPWGGHVAASHRPPARVPCAATPGGLPTPRWGVRARREGGDGDTGTGLRSSAPLRFGGDRPHPAARPGPWPETPGEGAA